MDLREDLDLLFVWSSSFAETLNRDALWRGMQNKAQSGSALNRRRTGCGIPCDGLRCWTLCRRTGISSHGDVAPRGGAVRTARDRAADEVASVGAN